RIMERVEKEHWGDPGLGGIEKGGRHRGTQGDDKLPRRWALRRGLSCKACHRYPDQEPQRYRSAHRRSSLNEEQEHIGKNFCECAGVTYGSGCRTPAVSRRRKCRQSAAEPKLEAVGSPRAFGAAQGSRAALASLPP